MQLYQILQGPVVTEKSVQAQESNTYTFWVHSDATKIDVENALGQFYGVRPVSVRMVRLPKKVRMVGRSRSITKRKAKKKAIVRLKKGENIELVDVKKAEKKS